ncbi:MAG: hypothetical protein M1822_006940 [Bathelium mastoideum]|nr:MAG: hypothetical protein M1822_006940 [Bathelium mastoideum]
MSSFLRNPVTIFGTLNLVGITASTLYLRSHHVYNLEEHEARMDELEGTLRGHIGYIEEALDRLEGKAKAGDMGKKIEEYYSKRGKDEKNS